MNIYKHEQEPLARERIKEGDRENERGREGERQKEGGKGKEGGRERERVNRYANCL